jgi:hypothetical protein
VADNVPGVSALLTDLYQLAMADAVDATDTT